MVDELDEQQRRSLFKKFLSELLENSVKRDRSAENAANVPCRGILSLRARFSSVNCSQSEVDSVPNPLCKQNMVKQLKVSENYFFLHLILYYFLLIRLVFGQNIRKLCYTIFESGLKKSLNIYLIKLKTDYT